MQNGELGKIMDTMLLQTADLDSSTNLIINAVRSHSNNYLFNVDGLGLGGPRRLFRNNRIVWDFVEISNMTNRCYTETSWRARTHGRVSETFSKATQEDPHMGPSTVVGGYVNLWKIECATYSTFLCGRSYIQVQGQISLMAQKEAMFGRFTCACPGSLVSLKDCHLLHKNSFLILLYEHQTGI